MRTYKRKSERSPITPEIFERVKQLLQTGLSKRRVVSELGFSEGALRKRLKLDCGVEKLGRFKATFNEEQGLELAQHAVDLGKRFYGLTLKSLRKLAYEYATANNIPNSFSNEKGMAGKYWVYSFLKKHKLALRTPSKTSVARAMGFNKTQLDLYFQNLQMLIDKHKFSSSKIYNMDETGLSTVPNKTPKVVAVKGKKLVGKIVSAERGQTVTAVCCMSAAGNYVPPALIFPRKRRKLELIDGAPPDSLLLVSDSGYINSDLFLEWLQHFQNHVKASATNPILLILDNHSSHTSLQAILFAREHHIHLLSLPPHSSHKTQPLDRCFFKPLKDYYSQAGEQWLTSNAGRTITQYQVASLFSEAYTQTASVGKAVKSFKICGIWPLCSSVFTDEDFLPSAVTDQRELHHANADVLNNDDTNTIAVEPLETASEDEAKTANQHIGPSTSSEAAVRQDFPDPSLSSVAMYTTDTPIPSSTKVVDRPYTPVPSTSKAAHDRPQTPRPSTSKEVASKYISPTQILPIPKKKDAALRQSKGKRSEILTSTPVKNKVEEATRLREEKAKGKVKKDVFGTEHKMDKKKAGPTSKVKSKVNKEKGKKTSFEKKIEVKQSLQSSEENVTCPGCEETFFETPNDDWVQCNQCGEWWHDDCSPYEGVGEFICDYCV